MNPPIVRLFTLFVLLFAVLLAFTSRWTVFEAEALRDNPNNRRAILAEERIKRGVIRSSDGKVLAGSTRLKGKRYGRRYPTGELFGHPIGYSYTRIGRSGLERSRNDQLIGRETELVSVVDSLFGRDQVGHDIQTTLNARAQEVALRGLDGKKGAVVALDVKTGAVLVMASAPAYDPNGLDDVKTFEALNRDNENSRLLNRATQGLYPPGSTMKVVTAAAALDSGRYKPETQVSGKNAKKISGVPLNNFGNQDFGEIDLTTALTKSVNTVWAEVAEKLGKERYAEYMERFGFGEEPRMDYPGDQIYVSGTRRKDRVVSARSDSVDIGRVGIGQGTLLVTPLQMAMVVQTVANGGRRMVPYITQKVLDEDGRTVEEHEPEEAAEVISEDAASKLRAMMLKVVEEGTGTAAALKGVQVAGKTGTAELNLTDLNQPWFTGFTDRFAVAVTVERVQGGTGGEVAAPIAKQVLEALGE